MSNSMQTKNIMVVINQHMKSFFANDDLHSSWMEEENQTTLQNIIKTHLPKTKSKTRPKDKNAPKKARSAYIYFGLDLRNSIKSRLEKKGEATDPPAIYKGIARAFNLPKKDLKKEDIKQADVMALTGTVWKLLQAAEKSDQKKVHEKATKKLKECREKAAKDEKRYKKEMKSYQPSEEFLETLKEWDATHIGTGKNGKPIKPKDPMHPRKAQSGYQLFCAEIRADGVKHSMKELGKMWRELDEEEKQPYQERFKEDKERYDEEMKSYEPSESFLAKLELYKTEFEKWKIAHPEEAKAKATGTRSKTAWMFFTEKMRPKLKKEGITGKDVMKELSKLWKNMSKEKKARFEKLAEKAKAEKLAKEAKESEEEENAEEAEDTDEEEEEEAKPEPKKARVEEDEESEAEEEEDSDVEMD